MTEQSKSAFVAGRWHQIVNGYPANNVKEGDLTEYAEIIRRDTEKVIDHKDEYDAYFPWE